MQKTDNLCGNVTVKIDLWEKNMKYFIGLVYFLFLIVVTSIFNGYVLSVLWGWFIVPTFVGAPQLLVVTAIGITLVVQYLTHQIDDGGKKEDDDKFGQKMVKTTVYAIAKPLLALFIGWIVHQYM